MLKIETKSQSASPGGFREEGSLTPPVCRARGGLDVPLEEVKNDALTNIAAMLRNIYILLVPRWMCVADGRLRGEMVVLVAKLERRDEEGGRARAQVTTNDSQTPMTEGGISDSETVIIQGVSVVDDL